MYFNVDQNNKLWYRFFGKKSNPLVIYLHGGPGGYHDLKLKNYIDLNKYSFLTYDQRGCGKSLPFLVTKGNTFRNNVKDLNKLVENFSKKREVILIGDSYGTQLALAYSIRYPHKVSKMILTGLWTGSKDDVNNLYSTKAKKYHRVANKLFSNEKIDLSKSFLEIKKGKNIYSWLAWEDFLANPKKKKYEKQILKNEPVFEVSKIDKGIAFYETYFFSRKEYFKNEIKLKDIKKISSKINIFHGKLDEVCQPLNTNWLNRNKIQYTILPKMGHMPKTKREHKIIFSQLG